MEVIFNNQILYQRDVIAIIGRTRRKWKRLYCWYPKEQRRLYKEADRIYEETMEKEDKEIFMEYCRERRINERITKRQRQINRDKADYEKFASLKPTLDKFGHFPLLYYDDECGSPGYCQQQKNDAM